MRRCWVRKNKYVDCLFKSVVVAMYKKRKRKEKKNIPETFSSENWKQ